MSERKHQTEDKYSVRFPDGMREALKTAAKENSRSLNAEIVARLEDYVSQKVGNEHRAEVTRQLQVTIREQNVEIEELREALVRERVRAENAEITAQQLQQQVDDVKQAYDTLDSNSNAIRGTFSPEVLETFVSIAKSNGRTVVSEIETRALQTIAEFGDPVASRLFIYDTMVELIFQYSPELLEDIKPEDDDRSEIFNLINPMHLPDNLQTIFHDGSRIDAILEASSEIADFMDRLLDGFRRRHAALIHEASEIAAERENAPDK